jgi:hypothetical protein
MECGLLYFRLTLVATKFCIAEEFRDVPLNEPAPAGGRCGAVGRIASTAVTI